MTTIAANTETLAVDSMICQGEAICEPQIKLFHMKGFGAVACAGEAPFYRGVAKWIFEGAKPEDRPEEGQWLAITLTVEGKLYRAANDEPYHIAGKTVFVGSGCHFAMGAYHVYDNPVQAVDAAIKLDTHTGSPIEFYVASTDSCSGCIEYKDGAFTDE